MRYEATIDAHSLGEIPDLIKLEDNTSAKVKNASVIIKEFDKSIDPIHSSPFDKGFSVALKLEVEKRYFAATSVRVERDWIGNFMDFSCDATLKDVMNGINELIHRICNNDEEPSEA